MKCISMVELDYMDAREFRFEDGTSFSISRLEMHLCVRNGGKLKDLLMSKYYELIKERTLKEQKKLEEQQK